MTGTDHTQKYFDALLESYNTLLKAIEEANDRGIKLSKQFIADATDRQREAIELARKVAADPTNYAAAYSAVMEATVAAQSQALELTQLAYKEAVSASAEAREFGESLMKASRAAAESAVELSKEWAAHNPWADLFRKGAEAFGNAPQTDAARETSDTTA